MTVENVRPEVWWTRRQVKPWKKRDIAKELYSARLAMAKAKTFETQRKGGNRGRAGSLEIRGLAHSTFTIARTPF
jgi:hypothetical protein